MAKMSNKTRDSLDDSQFGIPDKRAYPLNDKPHIKAAARMFGHADSSDKPSLARKILFQARKSNINTSGWKKVLAYAQEQVPPMSDGTSLGNAPPRTMAPYYDEQNDISSRLDGMDTRKFGLTYEKAKRIVSIISSKVETDAKPPTGNQNCQLCTWCAEAQCRDINVLPRPVYSPRDPSLEIPGEMIVMNPTRQKISSQRDVVNAVRSNLDSRWYVHVNWKDSTGGHEFLVVNVNNYAYIMDAQAGELIEIDEMDTNSTYFNDINYENSYMSRLDNHPFNNQLLTTMNDMRTMVPWDESKDIPYMKEHGMLSEEDLAAVSESEPVQEAACNAALLNVKNQLTNLLGGEFEFIGGSLIPKFTMKSKLKPEVSIEVNVNGQNIEATPQYNNMPDLLQKRRVAIMRAASVIADFAREVVSKYTPKPVKESYTEDYSISEYKMRKAKESDLELIYQSELDTVEHGDDPKVQKEIRKDAKDSLGHTMIITMRGKAIGVYQGYPTNYYGLKEGKLDWWYLAHIYIIPEYRGMHIGTAIIREDMSKHDKILLHVLKSNTRARKLYSALGFKVSQKTDDGYVMRYGTDEKPIQESAHDNTLIPVNDFKYDKVYYGDPTNGGSVRKLDGKPLFVTPRASLATIFLGRRELFHELSRRGYPEVNLGYDEWNNYASLSPDEPLTEVHVYVRNHPDLKPFTMRYEGYLHTIDISDLKDNIYRYKWMSDIDQEVLIANVPEVKIDNIRKLGITYHVRGIPGNEPGPIQESKTTETKTVHVPILYKKWSTENDQQYDPISHFWDIVEQYVDCTKLRGFGYGWDNGSFVYGIIFKMNGVPEEIISAVKKEFPDMKYDDSFEVPTRSSYDNSYDGKTANIRELYEKIWNKGALICELEEFKPNGECKIHVMYKAKHIQEGAVQDIKNGVNPYSDKLVFHVTPEKHADGQVWKPRVPDYLDPYNPEETGFEDNTTPRICFSTSIEGALNGITVNIPRQNPDQFDKLYVYIPEKPWKEYKHKTNKELVKDKLVYDANVTREVWIMEPVRMKLYGVIRVDQVSDVKRKQAVPTSKGEKYDRHYYTYKWHWVVKPKVLKKGTVYDYTPENVIDDLCIDLKKFKYGLIKDGKLQTGNVSDADYDKHWVYHTGEEVDEAGGGNCWDMVEYEAGYLESFGVPYKKYFMNFTKTDGKTEVNTHTICVVPLNGKYIYLEQAFKRITDEWGYDRRKTFDNLKDIFKYVAEVSAEYENQDLNYGVWDYTNEKFEPGTPGKEFMNWIMSKCRMIYDGEAKKPTIKKEGYHMSRFGNMFQEEKTESLSETEDITIGDLDLEGTESDKKSSDDEIGDDGPGLPEYMEDRMSDDDLESFKSEDEEDFEFTEDTDDGENVDRFKVSDTQIDDAQPDENLNADNVDLGQFGRDTSDVQNEYDPKEVTILMKLMASEADAMNEYMDGAKETNVDVLRRLYADIANEERFHMEQLLYAKCELTGEKYVPKDPEVKSEYEELLKMGMDEDTAMQTAVDRCHIRGSISFEDDVDDMKSIQADFETMESALMMFGALYDSTEYIMESSSSTEDVERAINTFVEAFVVSETVYDATAATSVKSPLSTANKRGPIMLLADAIRFLGKAIVTMVRKFVEFTKRVSNYSREISNFIKQNGLGAIFDKKVSFYFINLKFPNAAYIDQHLFSLLALSYDTLAACAASLNMPFQNNFMPTDITRKRDPQLKIGGNMVRGAELLQGVQLIKTPFVLPKDTDMQEQMRIAHALFGLTGLYGDDGKSINTLNSLKIVCDSWSHMMQAAQKLIDETGKLQQNPQSLYYKNRKKFDQTVKCMEAVVKTCKAWVTAMQSDISTIIKLDNTAMIAATENIENASKSINPRQRAQSDMYEQTIRTPESAGKPKKVNRFSGQ